MKPKPVTVIFNPEKKEMQIRIGNDTLEIPHFMSCHDKDTEAFINTLDPSAQEMIIKKLIANVKLTGN